MPHLFYIQSTYKHSFFYLPAGIEKFGRIFNVKTLIPVWLFFFVVAFVSVDVTATKWPKFFGCCFLLLKWEDEVSREKRKQCRLLYVNIF